MKGTAAGVISRIGAPLCRWLAVAVVGFGVACGQASSRAPLTAAHRRTEPVQSSTAALPPVFRFEAAPGCPERGEFIERVSQLSNGVEPKQVERRLARLLGSVRVSPHEVKLWLRPTADGEAVAARRLVAESCQEATSAAALIAAIALRSAPPVEMDPGGERAAQSVDRVESPRAEPRPRVQSGDVSEPQGVAAVGTEGAVQAEDSGVGAAPSGSVSWALAATAGTDRALGPGFPAVVSVGIGRHWGAWSVQVSALHARSSAQPDGRRAEFVAWAGSGDVCRRVAGSAGWQVGACALLRVGALEGSGDEGSGLRVSYVESRTLVDPGFALSARTPRVVGLRARLELGAMVPVFQNEFRWESPRRSVYSVPAVAPFAMLGLELPAAASR